MRSFGFHRFLVAAAAASSLLVGISTGAFADAWP
ncbi:MAG TPA: ABC transporter substrate-binding protein, partial [Afipia sp.]|nr:ABC transporter substrate-binding protein [Afipia sp.]